MLPLSRLVAIALILLLIVAFTIISIFSTGLEQVETFVEARAACAATGQAACDSVGDLPFSWLSEGIRVGGEAKSCADIMGCQSCESCGFI